MRVRRLLRVKSSCLPSLCAQRGPQGLRVMQGLLQLAEKHSVAELERAAQVATRHAAWRLRDLKRLIEQPINVIQLQFLETHPLIRPLAAYRVPLPTDPPQQQTPQQQRP